MENKKYTFVEFIVACESDDFDNPDLSWMDWATTYVNSIPEVLIKNDHDGDCNKKCYSCELCLITNLLNEYDKYYFNEKEWRKENDI